MELNNDSKKKKKWRGNTHINGTKIKRNGARLSGKVGRKGESSYCKREVENCITGTISSPARQQNRTLNFASPGTKREKQRPGGVSRAHESGDR